MVKWNKKNKPEYDDPVYFKIRNLAKFYENNL